MATHTAINTVVFAGIIIEGRIGPPLVVSLFEGEPVGSPAPTRGDESGQVVIL
jgi:hypothetical protein